MALSGSAEGSGNVRLKINWSATQDIANNRSTVTAKVYLVAAYNVNFSAEKSGSVTVNGVTKNWSTSSRYSGTGTWLLTTQTFTVPHNADGTKSFSFSAWYDINITFATSWLGRISASGTGALNTIPRASKISNITGGTLGSPVTVEISRASTSFFHSVYYIRSDGKIFFVNENIGTSVTFTPEIFDSQYLPNSTSGTAQIVVDTWVHGGGKIGTDTKSFTVTVPASAVPTIDTVKVVEYLSHISTNIGAYVQGKSRVYAEMTASGIYGSTIRSYKITANETSHNGRTYTTGLLKNSGINRITFEIIDSRGRRASVAPEINVLPYSNPIIESVKAVRANEDGTENDDGTHAKVTIKGSISPLDNKNTKDFRIYYKKQNASTWSEKAVTVSGYTADMSVVIPGFDVDSSYDIRFQVSDYFTAIQMDTILHSTFSLFNFHPSKKGMAFGGAMSRAEGLDIFMDTKFKQAPTIVAPTSTDEDGAFLRLRRLNESLLAFLATGAGGTGLKLHLYNSSGWTGYIKIDENGDLFTSGKIRETPDVQSLSLLNGWGFYGGNTPRPACYKDVTGTVHVEGAIDYGTQTAGTVFAQLPVGYRPRGNTRFTVVSYNDHALVIEVRTNGNMVLWESPGGGYIYLAGISFLAGN